MQQLGDGRHLMNFISIFTAENQSVIYVAPGGTYQCHGDTVGRALGTAGFQAVKTFCNIFPTVPHSFDKGI